MSKENTHRFFQLALIILLYEVVSNLYGFFCWMSIHGFLSASTEHRWQVRTLQIGFPVLFILLFYFFRQNKIVEIVLFVLNGLLLIAVITLVFTKPYVLDSDLFDPFISTTVYKVNHLIKYSGLISFGIIGAFASLKAEKITLLKIIWMILPLAATIASWFLLGLNVPSFYG